MSNDLSSINCSDVVCSPGADSCRVSPRLLVLMSTCTIVLACSGSDGSGFGDPQSQRSAGAPGSDESSGGSSGGQQTRGGSSSALGGGQGTGSEAGARARGGADATGGAASSAGRPGYAGQHAAGGAGAWPSVCVDFEIDATRVRSDVEYLASDAMQGRVPGSAENDRAMQYVEALFVELGVAPAGDAGGYRQPFSYTKPGQTVNTANVLGVVRGTGNEAVVVGAHIDHLGIAQNGDVYNGADDNASGVSVLMELARALICTGEQPQRSVVFAVWNAEEDVLQGSCHYANSAPAHPLANTVANLTLDMVGAGNGQGVNVYGELADAEWIADLVTGSAQQLGFAGIAKPASDRVASSDQTCFKGHGFPAVLFLALPGGPQQHPNYHQVSDDILGISTDALGVAAELTWAALLPLASGTEDQFVTP